MSDEGIHFAALYSAGCKELAQMNYDAMINSFVRAETGTVPSAQEARGILERLDPSVYYQLIAGSSGKQDYFLEPVVRAHWMGTDTLSPITDVDIRRVFANNSLKSRFDFHQLVALAMKLHDMIGFVPHHNFCVLQLFVDLKKRAVIPEKLIVEADRCLVKSGRVLSDNGNFFDVETLSLVSARDTGVGLEIKIMSVDKGFVAGQAVPTNFVSLHLGRARQVISGEDSRRLTDLTFAAVKFCNK